MNEITTTTVETIKETAIRWLDAIGYASRLNPKQKDHFIEICQAFGLNPFKREIYAVPFGDNFNIIVGYEVYLKRAERSGKLDGWEVDTTGNMSDGSLCATVTIYRKDWRMPFKHSAHLAEFSGKSSLWSKAPTFMLEKVAISQGFRMAFPDELGGIPYTAEETSTFAGIPDDEIQQIAHVPDHVPDPAETNSAKPTPKPIEEMTPDEIDSAIERGLQSEYPNDIARTAAVAKYPDKAKLLSHLREKREKRIAKAAKKQEQQEAVNE